MTGYLQRLHSKIYGRVQGVSFRYYTVLRAKELNVQGWVQNRDDGSVEVMAEGTREQLEDLLEYLHIGPVGAHVSRVEVEWGEASNQFGDFNVRQ
jgi:acylphosphatase